MDILHVIPGMANSSGPSQVVASLVDEFCNRGHECTIFYVTGRDADLKMPIHPRCRVFGFPATIFHRWAYSPRLGRELRDKIAGFDVVHIHSMWLYPNIAVAKAASRTGVPYIVRPAGSLEPWCFAKSFKKRLYLRAIERSIIDRSAALHAMSDQEANTLKQFDFNVPIFTLPKGQDLQTKPARHPGCSANDVAKPTSDHNTILFLGRIHHVKGLDILGEAFTIVRKKLPNTRLIVAGPDKHAYALEIKERFEKLGILENCRFLGEVTGAKKWDTYRSADVFVLSSRSENFGVAVLEALSAGIPAIVSQNAPWSILEEAGAGFWIENTPTAIAEKLIYVLADKELRRQMAANAARLVESRFSWSAVVDSMELFYHNIISGRAPCEPMAVE